MHTSDLVGLLIFSALILGIFIDLRWPAIKRWLDRDG
jgi:hypothetical protein